MAKKKTPEEIAADAVSKRSGFLPYSRYDRQTGALTDPDGTTVFSEQGPVRRNLRRGMEKVKNFRRSLAR